MAASEQALYKRQIYTRWNGNTSSYRWLQNTLYAACPKIAFWVSELGYIHSEFNDIRLQKKIRRVSRFVDIITEILIEMIIINAADDAPYVS